MFRNSLMAAAAMIVFGSGAALAQGAPGGETWQFQCPAAGTTVEQSSGAALRYRAAAAAPATCNVGGQPRLLGYWSVREGFFQAGGARLAAAFSQGVDLNRMEPVTFEYFGPNRFAISTHYQETWRAAPGGAVTTPAGTFDTVKVTRDFQVIGAVFSYTQSVWFDRATNAPVQARVEHLNPVQASTLVNWVATDVSRRQATAAR
ncbi:hypothetical protein EJV46_19880 [Roseococcus sp. SYP-B2431]|uniref:hypothetical protein n=1 Tax=Roseococcus sp. SYP-B2431 TaxID=2496640 RepID=UPI00103D8C7B|nr:hypothetical protein [Roseococcus sp. SYP-B2431]TCH96831.1 hypothetical protein EJV46_19880 [Roseococcus sp. SYP-B2431]